MTNLIDAILVVEQAHFRTNTDTGANPSAMLIMNALRRQAGLAGLTEDDLPAWNGLTKKYEMPRGSILLTGQPDWLLTSLRTATLPSEMLKVGKA